MSAQPRRSQRISGKISVKRRARAIAYSDIDRRSEIFPTLSYKVPRSGDNHITAIHPPILQRNNVWLVPTKWGGRYANDRPFLENPLHLLAHSPELLFFWRAHIGSHPLTELFGDFVDSLEIDYIPVVSAGAIVRFKADKGNADQLLFPFCRVRRIKRMKGLPSVQNDAAMYVVDHCDHRSIAAATEAEIGADRLLKIAINPPHPILSNQTMKGGAIARCDFDIVADTNNAATDQTRAFLIKASIQHSEYVQICEQNAARGALVWSFIGSVEQNGIAAYRGKLRANKCGKKTFANFGVLSEAAFIGGFQKRFREITDLQWVKRGSMHELDLKSETADLRLDWGTDIFRKYDGEGGYWFGDEISFHFSLKRSTDVGKLRMKFRVLFTDKFGTVNGRHESDAEIDDSDIESDSDYDIESL